MTRKLPMWRMTFESNRLLVANSDHLVELTWAWLLVMVPVYALLFWLDTAIPSLSGWPTDALVEIPFLSSVAVSWHQFILESHRVTGPYLLIDGPVRRYALFSFLFVLPVLSLGAIGMVEQSFGDYATFATLGYIFALLVAAIIASRFALVFPAIATQSPMTFAQSWALTRGNTLRLGFGSLIAIAPALALALMLGWNVEQQDHLTRIASSTLGSLIYALGATSGVTFLSLAFRFFANADTAIDGQPVER